MSSSTWVPSWVPRGGTMSLKSMLRLNSSSSKQSSSNASSSRQGWSAWQIAGACAAAAGAYAAYRVGRRLYVVFTFHDPAAAIEHGCVPADGDEDAWDHRPLLLPGTMALLRDLGLESELGALAQSGSLLAVSPAEWAAAVAAGAPPADFPPDALALARALNGGGGEIAPDGSGAAAAAAAAGQAAAGQDAAAAAAATKKAEDPFAWLRASADVRACAAVGPPPTLLLVGTSHVSRKSADDVAKVVRLSAPDMVFLELDPARASLMYRDREPEAAAAPPTTAALLSRALAEANAGRAGVLQALMSAMYQSLEAQLGVKAGLEFTAARRGAEKAARRAGRQWEARARAALRALPGGGAVLEAELAEARRRRRRREEAEGAGGGREQEQEEGQEGQQQQQHGGEEADEASGSGSEDDDDDEDEDEDEQYETAAAAGADAGADSQQAARSRALSSPPPPAPPPRGPVAGVQIVLGDRPASDTLKAMWAALTPARRVRFCWEVARALFEELDEEFVEAMKGDDLLTALFKEMREAFPELMRPLLHDRNYVLAVGLWRAGAAAAHARRQALDERAASADALAARELSAAGVEDPAVWEAARARAVEAALSEGFSCGGSGGGRCRGCVRCGPLVVAVLGKGHLKGVASVCATLSVATAAAHAGALW